MPHRPRRATEHVRTVGLAAIAAGCLAAPAGAQSTGGAAPVAPGAAAAPLAPSPVADTYGGPAPRITRLSTTATKAGATIRIAGKGLRGIEEVVFLGADADGADDASVAPLEAHRRRVTARVPRTARTGRLTVARSDGTRAAATVAALTIAPGTASVPAGEIDAEVQGHKVFYAAARPAELSYVLGGSEPADVLVELVRGSDGAVVARWTPGSVPPGVPQTVRWNGTAAGRVQPNGVYRFRVSATDASGSRATSAQTPAAKADPEAPGAFTFLGYRFPIVGAHRFGTGAASFGGGRGHQGHDTFAACGTPLVAARGGVVKVKQFHSRAGYYLVIDGAQTGTDFAYMHLREPALVSVGQKVRTGQLIGHVGDTGRASGCHLHFEEWTAPGWYTGGSPIDPLPDLRAWDAQS